MYLADMTIDQLDEVEIAPGVIVGLIWASIYVDVDEDTHEVVDIYLERNGQKPLILSEDGEHKALWQSLKKAIESEYRGNIIEHVREAKLGRYEADRDSARADRRETDGRMWA